MREFVTYTYCICPENNCSYADKLSNLGTIAEMKSQDRQKLKNRFL